MEASRLENIVSLCLAPTLKALGSVSRGSNLALKPGEPPFTNRGGDSMSLFPEFPFQSESPS